SASMLKGGQHCDLRNMAHAHHSIPHFFRLHCASHYGDSRIPLLEKRKPTAPSQAGREAFLVIDWHAVRVIRLTPRVPTHTAASFSPCGRILQSFHHTQSD